MAALGLHCCAQAFSGCGERGLLFVAVRIAHADFSSYYYMGLVVVALRLSCA